MNIVKTKEGSFIVKLHLNSLLAKEIFDTPPHYKGYYIEVIQVVEFSERELFVEFLNKKKK